MTSSKSSIRNVPPPATGAKAAAYARFIPREELGSFAAWNPDALSDSGPAPSPGLRRASDKPVAGSAAADDPAAALRLARHEGYQAGYRDGIAALEAFKQSFALQTTQQVGVLVASVGTALDALQQRMAQTLAATATELARQIVRSELAARPELVVAVAGEALETLLLSARHIVLRVHPDDHALVARGAGEALAARGARLLPDASVARGGCMVESDVGVIDASIETRWRRAAAVLGQHEGWADGQTADHAE